MLVLGKKIRRRVALFWVWIVFVMEMHCERDWELGM